MNLIKEIAYNPDLSILKGLHAQNDTFKKEFNHLILKTTIAIITTVIITSE
jgi:hypothetical protein